MRIKDFFSFKKNRFFWINILSILVVAIILVFITFKGLDLYTRHGEEIVVPDAKGMRIEQAKLLFHSKNLECMVADSTYVNTQPAGTIIDHVPTAGQKVKKEKTIYLTINTRNTPLVSVPDVANNSSVRQARAQILAAGFKLTGEEFVNGALDWVYDVKYNGRILGQHDKVPVGATLTLVVGNGGYERTLPDSITDETEAEPTTDEPWF